MLVSLDGYVTDPDGDIDWALPDEELHRVANDELAATDLELYGRGLWEVMAAYWPTADQNPDSHEVEVEFSRLWKDTEKVVFSSTLDAVEGNARVMRGDAVEEIAALKEGGDGRLAIGGPTLASAAIRAGLVDEFGLMVHPVVLGGGTPFFPPLDERLALRPLEERRFASGVTYLRYERAD